MYQQQPNQYYHQHEPHNHHHHHHHYQHPQMGQPMMVMPPGAPHVVQQQQIPPPLWPYGLGITDRTNSEQESCSCEDWECPICCNTALYYTDINRNMISSRGVMHQNCLAGMCCPMQSWTLANADLLGVRQNLEADWGCCESIIHIRNGAGVDLGKVRVFWFVCSCSETDLAVVYDTHGQPRFSRRENPACPDFRHWSGDMCGWQEFNFPVVAANNQEVAKLTYRFHCCLPCKPKWIGFKTWPIGVTAYDQELLMGLAHAYYWRSERSERKENNQQGGRW